MRAAEELAEDYWKSHSDTRNTIKYQTTPLYYGSENIPRGSIVDIQSSDHVLDKEIIVINDAEGIQINYNSGSDSVAQKPSKNETSRIENTNPSSSTPPQTTASPSSDNAPTSANGWTTAVSGMVFVSKSNRYYTSVVNPVNYKYVSLQQAESSGAIQGHPNRYAR